MFVSIDTNTVYMLSIETTLALQRSPECDPNMVLLLWTDRSLITLRPSGVGSGWQRLAAVCVWDSLWVRLTWRHLCSSRVKTWTALPYVSAVNSRRSHRQSKPVIHRFNTTTLQHFDAKPKTKLIAVKPIVACSFHCYDRQALECLFHPNHKWIVQRCCVWSGVPTMWCSVCLVWHFDVVLMFWCIVSAMQRSSATVRPEDRSASTRYVLTRDR